MDQQTVIIVNEDSVALSSYEAYALNRDHKVRLQDMTEFPGDSQVKGHGDLVLIRRQIKRALMLAKALRSNKPGRDSSVGNEATTRKGTCKALPLKGYLAAEVLLKNEVDPNIRHSKLVPLLLENGVEIDVHRLGGIPPPTPGELTLSPLEVTDVFSVPLQYSKQRGKTDQLLEEGERHFMWPFAEIADANIPNMHGGFPIHMAMQHDEAEAVFAHGQELSAFQSAFLDKMLPSTKALLECGLSEHETDFRRLGGELDNCLAMLQVYHNHVSLEVPEVHQPIQVQEGNMADVWCVAHNATLTQFLHARHVARWIMRRKGLGGFSSTNIGDIYEDSPGYPGNSSPTGASG
ncbi:hypothetical protein NM208_g11753 [Fusarium decemcellulare]|uniref:Uncharacterized protein n=1 Tax=Fusarium decemcellulare TaxID=57161 RepID=A0ACC1RRD4_9HYPO|nr:hypothetical protein NM208_g11753 [Fusarium decemcellulare]